TAALWIFRLLTTDSVRSDAFQRMILPSAAAGLVYYTINHALLCSVRGIAEGRRPRAIWRADYRWLWPHYAVLGMLGLLLAIGYVTFGWAGVLALLAPVAMRHLSSKPYMDRTAVQMDQL